jgi:hypothetical protein
MSKVKSVVKWIGLYLLANISEGVLAWGSEPGRTARSSRLGSSSL